MFGKLLKALFKTGKTATESVGKSMDFIDDVLEKEYITTTIDNIKESTGDAVERAGTIYQKAKNVVDDNMNMENFREKVDLVVEKGKEATSELADSMLEKSETLKNVMEEGKDIIQGLFGEEE